MLAERTKVTNLSRGYKGTADTIKDMHRLVAEAKLDPTMHRIATWIRLGVPGDRKGNTKATADAVFDWARRHGVFQRDQFQIERVEHPISSMQSITKARKRRAYRGPGLFVGDCDQFAIWVAALGGILGFHYAFETAKLDRQRPDEFSHVWSALRIGNQWVPYDASTKGAYPGWRPKTAPKNFKRWIEKPVEETMSGLNGTNGNRREYYYPVRGEDGVYPGQQNVPVDYFGWGASKEFDWRTPDLLDTDPSRLDLLVPQEPAIPAAELEEEFDLIRKEPPKHPGHRASFTQGDRTFDTGPRYRGEGRQPYYKVEKHFYPVSSKFNRIVRSDIDRSKVPPGTFYRVAQQNLPIRNVDVVMDQPMTIARRGRKMKLLRRPEGRTVVMRPRRMPAGMSGMGEMTALEKYLADTSVPTSEVDKTAKDAAGSVMDTVTGVISTVVKEGASLYAERIKADAAKRIAEATNRITGDAGRGTPVTAPDLVARPEPAVTPWYLKPWTIAGGLIVVGGVAYVATRPSGVRRRPTRRRRRRRR